MKLKPVGNRFGKRGNWKRGRRRNESGPFWPRTLAGLRDRLERPVRGEVSRAALATRLGVSDRTVRRWISGEDTPGHQRVESIRSWLKSVSRR